MNDLELDFVELLPVVDNALIGLVELTEFRCRIFYENSFIRVNLFGFSPISGSHFEIGAVFFYVEYLVTIEESHCFRSCVFMM